MNWLLPLAVLLLVVWVAAELLGFVLGAALHILWIVALVLIVMWAFRKFRAHV